MKLEKAEALRIVELLLETGKIRLPASATVTKRYEALLSTWNPSQDRLEQHRSLDYEPFKICRRLMEQAGILDAVYLRSLLDGLTSDCPDEERMLFYSFILNARELDSLLSNLEGTESVE